MSINAAALGTIVLGTGLITLGVNQVCKSKNPLMKMACLGTIGLGITAIALGIQVSGILPEEISSFWETRHIEEIKEPTAEELEKAKKFLEHLSSTFRAGTRFIESLYPTNSTL